MLASIAELTNPSNLSIAHAFQNNFSLLEHF